MTTKYSAPKKGNPLQFAIDQHVFPVRSLQRFADQHGYVTVRRDGCVRKLKPNNVMFCAKRAWDERTEKGLMKDIEDRFQHFAENILAGHQLLPEHFPVASRFYSLCRVRAQHRAAPTPDQPVPGVKGETLSLDQEENLEKNGYIFAGSNGVPGRMMAGVLILRQIDMLEHELKGVPWGIVTASQGEFVIPDEFGTTPIIPVVPTLCLVANWDNLSLDRNGVKEVNLQLTAGVKHYIVARNLDDCPL